MVVSWNTVGYCTKNTSCKGFQYNLSRGLGPIYTFQFDTHASRWIVLHVTVTDRLTAMLKLYLQWSAFPSIFVALWSASMSNLICNLFNSSPRSFKPLEEDHELSFLTVGVLSNLYTLHIWEKSWSSWKYQHTSARQ